MELYITKNSPFARVVRVLIHELGIQGRVTITLAQTRKENSPYYAINPSGRVPYLICDDGKAFENSELICEYLCALEKSNLCTFPDGDDGWEARRLHSLCRSHVDGVSVWLREIHGPMMSNHQQLLPMKKIAQHDLLICGIRKLPVRSYKGR